MTHFLRVHIGWNEVSIKLAADKMALRTHWELNGIKEVNIELAADGMAWRTAWWLKLVEKRLILN